MSTILRSPTAAPSDRNRPPGPGPRTGTARILADVLAGVLRVDQVPVESNFFDDLGADSMVMAQFCARVRKRGGLPSVSMKDVYRHPTIGRLAEALGEIPSPTTVEASTTAEAPPAGSVRPAGTAEFVLCGTLQFLIFVGYALLTAHVVALGFDWIFVAAGPGETYLRAAGFGAATFLGLSALPIVVKWVLIGRWKPQEIRIWSLAYVRFWVVKTLIRSSPLAAFAGSPLYTLYLRALGARVGRGVVIFARGLPVCTDLLTIGDGTIIRNDAILSCYRAHAGVIQTGPVTLGTDVFVGEMTVLDIGTSMGDGAQLGHASSLHPGQSVPDGEHWHGSPAQRTDADYRAVDPAGCSDLRRVVYSALQLFNLLVVTSPLVLVGAGILLVEVPQLAALLETGPVAVTSWTFYLDALVVSLVLYFGALIVGMLVVLTVPRLLHRALTPDKVYRLYGFHHWVHRLIVRMTNVKAFTYLFGDSSGIVHYLRFLGYDLGRYEQTGSNFGQMTKHGNPYLSTVGSGTMVADGLSIINADFSSTSFRVSRVSIGDRNYLGNNIAYPAQGRTGENCLLATKVMVPVDGPVRRDVGLLGSPCFEIPRSVERDILLDHVAGRDERRSGLVGKNRHNAVTIGLYLLVRWFYVFVITLLLAGVGALYLTFGAPVIALAGLLSLLFTVVYFVLVERSVTALTLRRPAGCSIYDRAFLRHERYWKVPVQTYFQTFNGTPFKPVLWRMLGVRVGRRVFDDGCGLSERSLVGIGDGCTLNAASGIQCHSQEDGAFKSDRSTIGAGVTLGVGALVHYGVTMGDGATLAADSFLMKGEEVPPDARWGGNPAREMQDHTPRTVAPTSVAPTSVAPTIVPLRPRRTARRAGLLVAAATTTGLGLVVASAGGDLPLTAAPADTTGSPRVFLRFPIDVPRTDPTTGAEAPSAGTPAVDPPAVDLPAVDLPAAGLPAAGLPAAVEPIRVDDLPQLDAGLREGSGGALVATVQQHLRVLGHYTGDVHGQLDGPTADAVRRFQAAARVLGDAPGTVGRPTAVALHAAGDPRPLEPGATGPDVHRLQHAVALAVGSAVGPDGEFGAATWIAVREYQVSRGLPVTGTVGPSMWIALQRGR